MSDFAETWVLVRGRFVDAVKDLNAAQLNWRMHPDAMTIGEMALHVAGVETYFCRQLLDLQLDAFGQKIEKCATEGVVNENPFPFAAQEITPEVVQQALELGHSVTAGPITNLTPELRERQVTTVLGPVVGGSGVMARLAYHPGYHHGQVYLTRTAPGFPQA